MMEFSIKAVLEKNQEFENFLYEKIKNSMMNIRYIIKKLGKRVL